MTIQNGTSLPFLDALKIKEAADAFRNEHWKKSVPVDIEHIIEIQMGIQLVPVPGLRRGFGIDAFITSIWGEIYVDKDAYDDERYRARVRFSLAHEIGHYVLHKKAYEKLGIVSVENYYKFTEAKAEAENTFHRYAEVQADMFANILLIPSQHLLKRRIELLEIKKEELVKANVPLQDNPTLNSYLAPYLSEEFGVSGIALKIALDRLDAEIRSKISL